MKKSNDKISSSDQLRQKAEKQYRKRVSKTPLPETESEILKLNHELSVHQIELEIQNDELSVAKEDLENAVAKYTELYDFAPTGYITLSRNGHIIGLNLAAASLIGTERGNLINKMFESFIKTDSKPVFDLFLQSVFSGKIKQSCEVNLSPALNKQVSVFLVGTVSNDGLNCDISMVDVTGRNESEEKLKNLLKELTLVNLKKKEHEETLMKVNKEFEHALQAISEINRFISILAHDLRAPFSVILGYSQLLADNIHQFSPDKIEKISHEIYESTQMTFDLLEDLLRWARMQSGHLPFKPEKIDFNMIWEAVDRSLAPAYCAKNITLTQSIPEGIEIFADSDMLKTILRNLISNSIQYSKKNGTINVTAEQTDSSTLFSVADTGTGISPQHLEKIFSLDASSSDISTDKVKGFGLFLCKGFVQKHDGKIWAESILGTGSIFYFTLPGNEKTTSNYVSLKPDIENDSYNLKVLVADDNDSLRLILGELVKKYSKEIFFAGTGVEAVELFLKNPGIDLVLMDFFMPVMNGLEATKRIRKINDDVIIFVETADTLSNIQEEFAGIKINDFFPKPYSKSYLNELITKHFIPAKMKG